MQLKLAFFPIFALLVILTGCNSQDAEFKNSLQEAWEFKDPLDVLDPLTGTVLGSTIKANNYDREEVSKQVKTAFEQKYGFEKAKTIALDYCKKLKEDPNYSDEAIDAAERDLSSAIVFGEAKADSKETLDKAIDIYITEKINIRGKSTYCYHKELPTQ